MEASLLSAAVTGMLKILGNKLAPLVVKEYSSIVGVKKELQELQDQVQEINCNLEKTGHKAPKDAPWLKKLKEVVYDIDDIVDEFQLRAEKHETNGDGRFLSKSLLTKKAESLVLQCRAAKNIKKIKKRFAKIVKQRSDMTAIFGNDAVSHINKTATNMQTLPVEEATVLGRDQEMHQIISDLVENNEKDEIKIVSIVGLGGSGKTTLAKLVFNDGKTIKNHFEVRLWVHVSQEFHIEKIIKKLYEAFADKDQGQPSLPYMSTRIQEGLTKKKFLVVMDDVWTESQNDWDKIMGYLKNGAPGSRVLLTTRSAKVLEVVRSTYQFCLQGLSPNDSWKLFQQSFRATHNLDPDFIKVGKEIVGTCCGLPLAIKVLAGSLGDKDLIGEWQTMRDILLDVEGEDSVSACLNLSYFHLPSNLKQCFTMCSLFPKGHLIHKQQLIDQWIAHDMICLTPGVDDLEHIGSRYFNSLVQVYFLQDVHEYEDGGVTCKMHDVIHDLARSILCEEISSIVPEDATGSTRGYRFFSLTEPSKPLPKKVFQNARAIYIEKGNDMLFSSTLKNAKRLRSIIIENSDFSTTVLTAISEVKNMKYLEMSELQCEALLEAITDVWSLQALYLKSTKLFELPESIGKLKKLRTLSLSRCYNLKTLPDSIGDCQMLSTLKLQFCGALKDLPNSIGNLTKLRTLIISWCSSLKTLPDSIGDCQMLSTLELRGCKALKDLPNSIGRNKRLRVLVLLWTNIRRLPSGITALENLEYLRINRCSVLVELPEGIGNLTKLKELDLDGFKGLPPGIGQLTQLEKLNTFCVETNERHARISELATLSRISGKLNICFLRDLTDQSEARQACLKQKENLHELNLSWGSLHNRENAEYEVIALDGLEPPSGIKQIKISAYAGGRFASWMLKPASSGVQGHGQFPFLTKMSLEFFPNLKHLDGLVQLPCLEELDLAGMPALESISGGPFPSLAKVKLETLHRLGEVWIVTDRSLFGKEGEGCSNHDPHQSGQLQIGSRLTDLQIVECANLVVKPHFPSSLEHLLLSLCQSQGFSSSYNSPPSFSHLKVLELVSIKASLLSPGLRLELLQHMPALENLEIFHCSDLTELPEHLGNLSSLRRMTIQNCPLLTGLPQSTGHLTSLQELIVQMCYAFVQFPESLGGLRSLTLLEINVLPVLTCLPKSLGQLTSLKELKIGRCKALVQLPEGLGELCTLRKLHIWSLPGLTCLPQSLCHLMSLQDLQIGGCDVLAELPECLGELHNLCKLHIWGLEALACLPQSLCRLTTSLKELKISGCNGIKSLPEWIKYLTTLQRLEISCCADLQRRCEEGTGEDWHLISHIRNRRIGSPHD